MDVDDALPLCRLGCFRCKLLQHRTNEEVWQLAEQDKHAHTWFQLWWAEPGKYRHSTQGHIRLSLIHSAYYLSILMCLLFPSPCQWTHDDYNLGSRSLKWFVCRLIFFFNRARHKECFRRQSFQRNAGESPLEIKYFVIEESASEWLSKLQTTFGTFFYSLWQCLKS